VWDNQGDQKSDIRLYSEKVLPFYGQLHLPDAQTCVSKRIDKVNIFIRRIDSPEDVVGIFQGVLQKAIPVCNCTFPCSRIWKGISRRRPFALTPTSRWSM
jgi:hypothetical protein